MNLAAFQAVRRRQAGAAKRRRRVGGGGGGDESPSGGFILLFLNYLISMYSSLLPVFRYYHHVFKCLITLMFVNNKCVVLMHLSTGVFIWISLRSRSACSPPFHEKKVME